MPQLDLFAGDALSVLPGIKAPRLWVQRFVIWDPPGTLVRDVPLAPGLNIVWSGGLDETRPTAQGVGHSSGKTLFCRLLRYCLGEPNFSPKAQRTAIYRAFPEGSVGVEVVLDGEVWAIVRPIGQGKSHCAIKGGDLDLLLREGAPNQGIQVWTDAVEQAFMGPEVARLLSGLPPWLMALAWMSRDQECRFSHPLTWRSPVSESGSPAQSPAKERMLSALKALIGDLDGVEDELLKELREVGARLEKLQTEAHRVKRNLDEHRDALATTFEVELLEGPFAVDQLRALVPRLEPPDWQPADDDLARWKQELQAKRRTKDDAAEQSEQAAAQVGVAEGNLTKVRGEALAAGMAVVNATNKVCPVCQVPVDQVLAHGCPWSTSEPDFAELRNKHAALKKQLHDAEAGFASVRRLHAEAKAKQSQAQQQIEALERQITSREVELGQIRRTQTLAWHEARMRGREVDQLEQMMQRLDRLQIEAGKQASAKESLSDRLAGTRQRTANHLHRVSRHFDALMRVLIDPRASSKVVADGNGLHLEVMLNGEYSSTAIDSLKVITFDLAVLLLSVEGAGHLPSFLIHDSPREADLHPAVYHRWFELIRDLEGRWGAPLFQYIITTTSSPPTELQAQPWLRLPIESEPAKARLLGVDLL